MTKDNPGFNTLAIHAGAQPDPTTGARATPIYQTTSFVFNDTDHAAALFGLQQFGNIYTRIMNPTQAVLEGRVASLEGAPDTALGIPGALAVSSGQAAETLAILNLAEAGDHIVSSSSLYGGTYNLFHHTLPKLGITTTFIDDPDDLDAWRRAVQPNTKAFFAESMFYRVRDASKVALVHLVRHLRACGYELLDIQQLTPHTERLGAVEIPRAEYLRRLEAALARDVRFAALDVLAGNQGRAQASK